MKQIIKLLFLLFISKDVCSQVMWQINKDTIIKWYYEDGDEFNDEQIDTQKWSYWYGWGRSIWGNKEQQYYTDGKNHEVSNGSLKLNARKENLDIKIVDWMNENDSIISEGKFYGLNKRKFEYTAGMILSKKDYLYGYYEIKFKTPKETGYWPAFWLYGGTPNEEIDWMELKTEKKNAIHVGRHSQKYEENKIKVFLKRKWWGDWVYFKGNLAEGYNVIAGEWTPNCLKYYLNGECIAYSKISMNIPKKLCANIAVPSDNGAFHPGPKKEITKSSDFEIDYIRVWTSNEPINKEQLYTTSTRENYATTRLKSKTKFLYGPKLIHKNEGFTMSVYPSTKNGYELVCLGKEIPSTATYTIKNDKKEIVETLPLKYGVNFIAAEKLSTNKFYLEINCFGKKMEQEFIQKRRN
jgi:beta-glucanase (GH16 family)